MTAPDIKALAKKWRNHMRFRRVRWSDNDRYFGPFTYAHEPRYRKIAVMLSSGDGDEYPGCKLRLCIGAHTLIVSLPALLKPYRRWVDTSRYEWSKGKGSGYWDCHHREFGFSTFEGSVHFHYGPQTHDSETTKSKVWFLPWRSWRLIRHSYFDLSGSLFSHLPQKPNYREWRNRWNVERAIEAACPTAVFSFRDFDGEELTATTRIEEREWALGERGFKWLGWFRKRVSRSLSIDFSGETGRRKGSWKGGTVGHSIEMLVGELHEDAFRRYCSEHEMAFIAKESAHV